MSAGYHRRLEPVPRVVWQSGAVIECVVNISEGSDADALAALVRACGPDLLDLHADPDHNRSVFTLIGTEAPRRLARRAVELLDIDSHRGIHPRLGVVDVVPFVPLGETPLSEALRARDEFARWAADELGLPVFVYGPLDGADRQLPDIRRGAWRDVQPTFGPSHPHPSAGAMCVGARRVLVAYNLWLEPSTSEASTRAIARAVRGDGIRSLALFPHGQPQVSMNLVEPERVGPDHAFDRAAYECTRVGARIARSELVGLIPRSVLMRIDRRRWRELDLAEETTIESRLGV